MSTPRGSLDVIGRLTAEHEEIINATGLLRRAAEAGRTDEVGELADEVAALLEPHMRAEEAGIFAVLLRDEDFAEHVEALRGEHADIRERLARIGSSEGEPADRFYHDLRAHLEREEDGIFPASKMSLGSEDWDEVESLTLAAAPTPPVDGT